jgi:hypothetical protein
MDRGLRELQRALADAAVSSQTGLEKKCSRRRVQGDGLQVATVSQLAVFLCMVSQNGDQNKQKKQFTFRQPMVAKLCKIPAKIC